MAAVYSWPLETITEPLSSSVVAASSVFLLLLKSGGDLRKLNSGSLDPLRERPYMVGQLRQHGRGPSLAPLLLQRPHRPTEVIAVLAEEGRRPMRPPVLREAIRLPHLPRVPVAVRPVVPLPELCVVRPARRRGGQRRLHRRGGAEDHPPGHLHHTPLLPRLVHRGIVQSRGRHLVGTPRPPRPAGP